MLDNDDLRNQARQIQTTTLDQMIGLMNEDLKNEYKHHRYYLHASFVLRGLERLHFGDWLRKQAAEELVHVGEFADKIAALGTLPTTESNDFPVNLTKAEDILAYALIMEKEVIVNYHERLKQAQALYDNTGQHYDIVLLYEDQVEDSQKDIDEMVRMVV